MKPLKLIVLTAATIVLAVTVAAVISAQTAPKEITVTGEVVDLWCYLEAGARGAEHKACAIACAKAGQPIGIVDEKEHVYLALNGTDKHQPAKDMLTDKMAETITVTGKVINKGGIEAIFINTVKEAPTTMPKATK
jgi:hypothetical protein